MVGTGATVLAVLLVIVVFGCTMQRLSGMGLGLVAGPVVSLLLGPVEGILVVNVLAVVNAALITATTWRNIDLRKFLTVGSTMILGAVPGALVIRAISTDLLQVLVGGTLLVALAVVTFGLRWVPTPHGRFPALVAGAVGGFMNTLAGIAGPAITVYAQAARWDHRIYAATLQPLFVVGGALSVIIKLVTGAGSLGGGQPVDLAGGIARHGRRHRVRRAAVAGGAQGPGTHAGARPGCLRRAGGARARRRRTALTG